MKCGFSEEEIADTGGDAGGNGERQDFTLITEPPCWGEC